MPKRGSLLGRSTDISAGWADDEGVRRSPARGGEKTKAPQTPVRVAGRPVEQPLPRGLLNSNLDHCPKLREGLLRARWWHSWASPMICFGKRSGATQRPRREEHAAPPEDIPCRPRTTSNISSVLARADIATLLLPQEMRSFVSQWLGSFNASHVFHPCQYRVPCSPATAFCDR